MWEKFKSWCWNSLTIAWAYLLIVGSLLQIIVPLALEVLSTPDVAEAIRQFMPGAAYGIWTLFLGAVTFLVRLRSANMLVGQPQGDKVPPGEGEDAPKDGVP